MTSVTAASQARRNITFQWIAATIIGAVIGLALTVAFIVPVFLTAVSHQAVSILMKGLVMGFPVWLGLAAGAPVGIAQAYVLEPGQRRAPAVWGLVTALGLGLSVALFLIATSWLTMPEAAFASGLAGGVVIGIGQAALMRWPVWRALGWIVATGASWMLLGILSVLPIGLLSASGCIILMAVVTGVAMGWLQPHSAASAAGPQPIPPGILSGQP